MILRHTSVRLIVALFIFASFNLPLCIKARSRLTSWLFQNEKHCSRPEKGITAQQEKTPVPKGSKATNANRAGGFTDPGQFNASQRYKVGRLTLSVRQATGFAGVPSVLRPEQIATAWLVGDPRFCAGRHLKADFANFSASGSCRTDKPPFKVRSIHKPC